MLVLYVEEPKFFSISKLYSSSNLSQLASKLPSLSYIPALSSFVASSTSAFTAFVIFNLSSTSILIPVFIPVVSFGNRKLAPNVVVPSVAVIVLLSFIAYMAVLFSLFWISLKTSSTDTISFSPDSLSTFFVVIAICTNSFFWFIALITALSFALDIIPPSFINKFTLIVPNITNITIVTTRAINVIPFAFFIWLLIYQFPFFLYF